MTQRVTRWTDRVGGSVGLTRATAGASALLLGAILQVGVPARALTAGAALEQPAVPRTPRLLLPDADSDGDGVPDGIDMCPATAPGTPVDAAGCSVVCAGGASAALGAGAGILVSLDPGQGLAGASTAALGAQEARRLAEAYGDLPLFFVENQGQMDEAVAYYVQGKDKTLYFTPDGITFALSDGSGPTGDWEAEVQARSLGPTAALPPAGRGAGADPWAVKLGFVGASPVVVPTGDDKLTTAVSYFKGRPAEWRSGLGTFGKVVYADLWPGIDLTYAGTARRLKYEFVVKPGADPGRIALRYTGATSVSVDDQGRLEVTTPGGGFRDQEPVAYQGSGVDRVEVPVGYELDADSGGGFTYGFGLGEYDPTRPLVIDPTIFIYSGYIGGTGEDQGLAIDVDSAGCAYVAGWTTSAADSFPVTVGPDLSHNGGLEAGGGRLADAFVAKVNAAGTSLIYAGYIGGDQSDRATGIAVDGGGNAYVTGHTSSTHATFPTVVGPDLTSLGGDAFVAKINAAGTALLYSGFIGGDGGDGGNAIAVDDTGSAYVAGTTYAASAGTFPATVGPDLTFNGAGFADGFVAKVKPDGTGLDYAGYIGGGGFEEATGIDVDGCGNAYVVGTTWSDHRTFPAGNGFGPDGVPGSIPGFDTTYNRGTSANHRDAFVAKVRADGSGLVYASYLGGDGEDGGEGVAVDGAGNAYVMGHTSSDESSFPAGNGFGSIPGYDHTIGSAAPDTFVVKMDPSGTDLVYATYIGGDGEEGASRYTDFPIGGDIAVDSAGNAYVTADTGSAASGGFPAKDGPDLTWGGGADAFVAKLQADGLDLSYAGYIGGYGSDSGMDIALDGEGNAFVAGLTTSNDYINPFPVVGGPDDTFNGRFDAFVAKIGDPGAAPPGPPPPAPECNPDADGDGVTDLDDMCPGTPAGTPVNSAGCALDQCLPLSPVAEAWWPGEGDAADALGMHDGALVGGTSFTGGLVGQAFSLDGADDDVDFGNSLGNFGRSDFTVEFWAKTASGGFVFGKRPVCGHGSFWDLRVGQNVSLEVDEDAAATNYAVLSTSGYTLNDDVYHHLAFVRRGASLEIHVDGQLAARAATSGVANLVNSADLLLTGNPCLGYTPGRFSGEIDEATVYGRALTAGEIRAIFLAGSAGKCPPPAPPCTTPGIVSWWPGDGHSRDVVSHHDGLRWHGAAYASGRVGDAFSFDGFDDFIEVLDSPDHTPASITIDAWVRPETLAGTRTVVSKYDTTAYDRQVSWLLFALDGGYVRFAVYGPGGWTVWRGIDSTAPVLTPGQWQHVAASFDAATQAMEIYVDGQVVPSGLIPGATTVGAVMDSASPVRIGAYVPASGNLAALWAGEIDEVAIHDRALSATEVDDIFQSGAGGRCNLGNEPPSISAGGPYEVAEGGEVALTGAGSDPEGGAVTFAWDLDGNGTFETPGQGVVFSATWLDGPSLVTVALEGCDDTGECATDTAQVTAINVAPTAYGDVADIDEGGASMMIDVLANDVDPAGPADPLAIVGVDTTSTAGVVSFGSDAVTYAPGGQFEALAAGETAIDTFGYSISDGDGGASTATVSITIHGENDAPTVEADNETVAVDEGDTAANGGTFADVDATDSIAISASIGAVSQTAGNAGTWTWHYVAPDGPAFTMVTIIADDGNGSIGTTTFDLAVNNVAPAVDAAPDQIGFENDTLSLAWATFTDPGVADTHTATIVWGDSTFDDGVVDEDPGTVTGSHRYPGPGTYMVTVTVADGDGGSGSDTLTVTVVSGIFKGCISASRADAALKLDRGAIAGCSVRGEGKVTVDKDAVVAGDLAAHSKAATIGQGGRVDGSVVSDDKIDLKKKAQVGGDVVSGQKVKLDKESSVGGDVTAAGRVDVKAGATVGGAITEGAIVEPLPDVTRVTVSVAAGGPEVTVKKNTTESLPPGSYGRLQVEDGGALTLGAGTYDFEAMDVGKDATLAFDLAGGDVIVGAAGSLVLGDRVTMTVSGGGPRKVLFRVAGTRVRLGSGGTFVGTFVAPDAAIELRQGAVLTGGLYGAQVRIERDVVVNGDPALGLIVRLFAPPPVYGSPAAGCGTDTRRATWGAVGSRCR